jgi:hypothetical protein
MHVARRLRADLERHRAERLGSQARNLEVTRLEEEHRHQEQPQLVAVGGRIGESRAFVPRDLRSVVRVGVEDLSEQDRVGHADVPARHELPQGTPCEGVGALHGSAVQESLPDLEEREPETVVGVEHLRGDDQASAAVASVERADADVPRLAAHARVVPVDSEVLRELEAGPFEVA